METYLKSRGILSFYLIFYGYFTLWGSVSRVSLKQWMEVFHCCCCLFYKEPLFQRVIMKKEAGNENHNREV